MDLNGFGLKTMEFIKKYRFFLLILVLGIVLMFIPSGKKQTEEPTSVLPIENNSVRIMTEELTSILQQIRGVGKVRVMLTVAEEERVFYQFDEQIATNESGSTIRKETVIITGSDRKEEALISHVMPATYLGAIIVCQGADQPAVKLSIVEAVSKITGLTADKISVLKMK